MSQIRTKQKVSRGAPPENSRAPRLQKLIAGAGLASRREAEQWILAGRITVNGRVVTQLGSCANPDSDDIRVDGRLIGGPVVKAYYAFHKPSGVVTTMKDEEGRPAVADFLNRSHRKQKVVPVGRLDYNSSGLLLLTNDGQLAYRLTHPRFRVKKVYLVKLSGLPSEEQLARLRHGIRLSDGPTCAAEIRVLRKLRQKAWVEVILQEGRHREVRRMMEAVGHTVERLVRSCMGPIALGTLPRGEIRPLSAKEVLALQRFAGLADAAPRARSRSNQKRTAARELALRGG